jgi:hypothetical protein
MVEKICPKCRAVIYDGDFCSECGTKLDVDENGFFNRMDSKISLSTLIFSFIVLGIFLFVGSLFFGIFASNGTINFTTHVLLTVIISVFLGGMFLGYFNCHDASYIVPNFLAFVGTIAASIICGVGGIFTVFIGFSSVLSSLLPSSSSGGSSGIGSSSAGSGDTNILSVILSNFILDIIILILLIPFAAYLGIYAGYLMKTNL